MRNRANKIFIHGRSLCGQEPEKILELTKIFEIFICGRFFEFFTKRVSLTDDDILFFLDDWEKNTGEKISLEKIHEVLRMAGGLNRIQNLTQKFIAENKFLWSVVWEHVRFLELSSLNRTAKKLTFLSQKFSISPTTVMKYRRQFFQRLSALILASCENENVDFSFSPLKFSSVKWEIKT